MQEFRKKKIHLSIVSDEYGGFSGIVKSKILSSILRVIVGILAFSVILARPFLPTYLIYIFVVILAALVIPTLIKELRAFKIKV